MKKLKKNTEYLYNSIKNTVQISTTCFSILFKELNLSILALIYSVNKII